MIFKWFKFFSNSYRENDAIPPKVLLHTPVLLEKYIAIFISYIWLNYLRLFPDLVKRKAK